MNFSQKWMERTSCYYIVVLNIIQVVFDLYKREDRGNGKPK